MAYEKKYTICIRLQNAIFCSLNLLAMAYHSCLIAYIAVLYGLPSPVTATLFTHHFIPGQQANHTCFIVPVIEPPDL